MVTQDTSSEFTQYAHPEKLVSTEWLGKHRDDPGVVIVESDEDVLLYETGHIPGAVKVDWHTELNDPLIRDYRDPEAFARLMSEKGIGRDDTIVFYGDNFNWWAAYALWVFALFDHGDTRLLDGGRQKWLAEGRPMTVDATARPTTAYPVVVRNDERVRAYRGDVLEHFAYGEALIDVRSPGEFSGELMHMPDYPQEGAMRGGHIPTASNVPWKRAANDDGTFKSLGELEAIYQGELGLSPGDDVITYCRIGERSSHTWFALTQLLGFKKVRNYDGSWTEWGNLVGVPIER